VSNLATTSSWYSTTPVAGSSTGLSAGSFSLQVGSGNSTTINIASGETLTQLASNINGQSLGVTASVVNDASGSRLSIVSNSSGSANDISVTGTSMPFTQATPGANASLTIDGIPISSASNTVTGAIPGVTLNLTGTTSGTTSTTSGTPVTLSVTADTNAISSAINQFVTDYNTVIGSVNTEYTYSSTNSTAGPLEGDSTLGLLQNALLGAGSYSVSNNGAISTLGSLGITMNNDGTLTVDSSTLDSAVQNNPTAVQNFFEGSALNGFSAALNTQLQGLTEAGDGAFTVDLSSMQSTYTGLQSQVTDFQTNYIAPLQTSLTAEYNSAEIALQTLNTTKQEINAELGNNTSNSGN
jgi:flagellar hook-associated protein 2